MAARATELEVKEIIDTALTAAEVTPYLRGASAIVDNLLSSHYNASTLREIETWLTAHMIAARDPDVSREKIGDGEWTYGGKLGEGLASTRYGQRVILFDYLGVLASASKATGLVTFEALDANTSDT
jgi:hypothetical protein